MSGTAISAKRINGRMIIAREVRELKLNSCYNYEKQFEKFIVEWCCSLGCFKTYMKSPKNLTSLIPSSRYEEPTSLEVCKIINDEIKRLFCYSDVAEITNNVTICYLIYNPDIFYHCLARVESKGSYCDKINDLELRKACHQSVELKLAWKNNKMG